MVEVYFDDFKVEHVKSPVIESQSYYPFGLTFESYQRENSLTNKFKFQSQEHVADLGLNWDSFKWRNHQPDIGRFFNVDPLSEKYYYNSPYAFSENKVTAHVELEGLEAAQAIFGLWDAFKAATGLNGTNVLTAVTGTQGLQNMQQGVTREASATADLAVNGGPKIQEAVNNGESPQAVLQQGQQEQANGRNQMVAGAFQFGASMSSMAAGFVGPVIPSPTGSLSGQVNQATKVLQNAGESPATVVAAGLPNGATTVATSGPVPTNIAPALQNAANNIGGVGTVGQNGFTIGCCAEFHAGNQLLLNNPEFTPGAVKFSPAVTPRTGNVKPMCDNCKAIFGNN